ncbi:ATP-binding cassette domain-containing protein [Chryseobacterium flavum]|uniref:ATP-binding cassette domain-containing protein n=1 Tax=Chryseobacterium flavum TaxID=415851 RepID=UPI0028B1C664|nr:ATP-binding cassette domain-containing protein [Chryseobacterium flavum]
MKRLHIDSITKSFNNKKILQDIYLECETGSITGILGRNGSGKSTLLKIIFGVIHGDTQFIKYDGRVLKTLSDRKEKIAYLPQVSFLPKNKKIKNLIQLFCSKENYGQLSSWEPVGSLLNEKPRNLSGGELRLIEVLLIIFSEAEFILLDEPFHSLSPKIVYRLKEIIRQQSIHKGFIISDHNYPDVLDISDSVFLLSNCHLKQIQDFKELQLHNYLPKSI